MICVRLNLLCRLRNQSFLHDRDRAITHNILAHYKLHPHYRVETFEQIKIQIEAHLSQPDQYDLPQGFTFYSSPKSEVRSLCSMCESFTGKTMSVGIFGKNFQLSSATRRLASIRPLERMIVVDSRLTGTAELGLVDTTWWLADDS